MPPRARLTLLLVAANAVAFAERQDLGRGVFETIDPRHFGHVLALFDLPRGIELDLTTRHVGSLPTAGTPTYNEAGFRIGWRVTHRFEVALIGRDVLHADHVEFISPTSTRVTRLERAVYTRAADAF